MLLYNNIDFHTDLFDYFRDVISDLNMYAMFQGWEFRDRWVYMLMCVICVPYCITFFECIFKALFGNHQRPSLGNLTWASILGFLNVETAV